MSVNIWSQTAATNANIDPTVNWRESQAPSTVNNSARAMMAAIAKWRDDVSGNIVTGGSSTAYTITTNQGLTPLVDGYTVTARMDETSGEAPELNVDSTGLKPIRVATATAAPTGSLRGGSIQTFTYDSGDDCWYVHGSIITATRDSLGLDTDDSPQFAGLNIGHASDTTITRTGAGDIAVEGNGIYRAGGTDVAIADGGTGASTAADAFTALKQAASDTATGVLEIAVQSEMETGTSTTLAVTPGRQHFHPGHPKAGGNLDGTGTPAFAAGDYGMGAVTDNGGGDYTLAFDTAFANTNYWWAASARASSTTGSTRAIVSPFSNGSKTTSALQLGVGNANDGAALDSTEIGITFWGDYA
jgi:hypothetical protein